MLQQQCAALLCVAEVCWRRLGHSVVQLNSVIVLWGESVVCVRFRNESSRVERALKSLGD